MTRTEEMPTSFVPCEQPVETALHLSDGTYVKAYRIARANTGLPQHSHAYSHTSYIATGSVKVWADGAFLGIVKAPDGILIRAHSLHFFQTLEPNTTILCIHALTDGEQPRIEQAQHAVKVRAAPIVDRASGFTFQEEDYDSWLGDAAPLFREHMTATGQDPDGAMQKNIPLGRQLAATGALMVTTARQNGRLFAYLMAMVAPTLDEAGVLTAHLLLPFASRDAPGAGKQLHIATIEMLRAKGISQIYARAGIRGDGQRLGGMYRRLGFVDDGQLYRLDV